MDELGQVCEAVSRYFTLLSEPMRVRILHAICQREKTVSEIVAETGATQTNVSRHLGTMHRAGVLTRRKDGNFIYYGVGDSALTEICRTVCVHIASRDEDAAGRNSLLAIAKDLDPAFARPPLARNGKSPGATQGTSPLSADLLPGDGIRSTE
ncbi:ArsR/SmtB family transcription factor [Zeimonas arvi]|uniref:Winged helix-turn-helix transcriptional regulator n=1 Tax=Zeimonas arvi TaxID=2498847 RepID=A0A5C8NSJ2_9BURK|nr:metalloregulator ArsR/SmtB family transcription factor [Zeimonas arvi]TXL63835.1 winged helix-turn-helix transcriptional regulator [Zeimonas arvi]